MLFSELRIFFSVVSYIRIPVLVLTKTSSLNPVVWKNPNAGLTEVANPRLASLL